MAKRLREGRKKESNKRKRNLEERKRELEREKKTYRNEEKLLRQAFYAEKRREFGWRFDRTQDMCARTLECKSKEANRFKWVFIPPIKNNRAGFLAHKVKEIPIVRLITPLNMRSTKPPEFNEGALCKVKNNCAGFPAHKVKEIPTVKLPSHR